MAQGAVCDEASHPQIGDKVDTSLVFEDAGIGDEKALKVILDNLCTEYKKTGGECFIGGFEPHGSVKIKVEVSISVYWILPCSLEVHMRFHLQCTL